MSGTILNFALLFEEHAARKLVNASMSLEGPAKLDYVLGEKSLPHVTILQFPKLELPAETAWQRLNQLALPSIHLTLRGLAFNRWREWDGLWFRVNHCPELRGVQEGARRALGNLTYVNGVGNEYEPHATLGAWKSREELPPFNLNSLLFELERAPVHYALGVSGPQFQFAECLFKN